jgi:hypothetical protein
VQCGDEFAPQEGRVANAHVRYGLLGFANDILEVRQLARGGGIGPLGPKFERQYWHEGDAIWSATAWEPNGEGADLSPPPSGS